MAHADALSRAPVEEPSTDDDPDDTTGEGPVNTCVREVGFSKCANMLRDTAECMSNVL